MTHLIELNLPDMGDFSDLPIIEIFVNEGDRVVKDQPLLSLESDKATMDVPAEQSGTIKKLHVKLGDTVSKGSLLMDLLIESSNPEELPKLETHEIEAADQNDGEESIDLVVVGAGPGGYTAAFRAADLGLKVILVERYSALGGVCLNVGCIPSKALLHAAKVIDEAEQMAAHGIDFGTPKIDIKKLGGFKDGVVNQLTQGLKNLAKQRNVQVVQGDAQLLSSHQLQIVSAGKQRHVSFKHCILATGSQALKLPGFPWDDPRLMDSTDALDLEEVPARLLIVGGGIIGLELACVYDALGSKVTVVELSDQLIPGADKDLVKVLQKRIKLRYENIFLKTKVTQVTAENKGLVAHFSGEAAPKSDCFDRVLVAIGRSPNGNKISADKAGIYVDERGFIPVDDQQRTNVPHIFAIGDLVGQPMLAHKASHEAKVAAEVCSGMKSHFVARVIPSVAYTDPELAWVGLTEAQAKDQSINVGMAVFPWLASGRALGVDRSEGMTKLLVDKDTDRVIGVGIVGVNAGELIAEATLAIEMGCNPEDIGLTIHPHPTLSETLCFSAESYEGTITDLYLSKNRKA